MENTPHLYDTLVYVLSQHAKWVDQPDSLAALCGESRQRRPEDSATVSSLARQRQD